MCLCKYLTHLFTWSCSVPGSENFGVLYKLSQYSSLSLSLCECSSSSNTSGMGACNIVLLPHWWVGCCQSTLQYMDLVIKLTAVYRRLLRWPSSLPRRLFRHYLLNIAHIIGKSFHKTLNSNLIVLYPISRSQSHKVFDQSARKLSRLQVFT